MKSLVVTLLMGGAYWLGVASHAQHATTSEIYRLPPAPAVAVLQVSEGECREIQRLRERMAKIRGRD